MQKLHNEIRRLGNDVSGGIDDISRMISIQYMKKKTNELRARQNSLSLSASLGQTNPATLTSIRNLSLKPNQESQATQTDLYNNHPAVHNYGRIEQNEKSFESIGRQTGERSQSQNYQPL